MSKIQLKVYSRDTVEGQYPNGLAYSVHFSLIEDGVETPLHNNYGILFPKAFVNEENVIVPNFVSEIRIAKAEEGYYLTGSNTFSDGSSEGACDKLWCWSTKDFISFTEYGLISSALISQISGLAMEQLREASKIDITEKMAAELKNYWNPLTFRECKGDTVIYSDGSSHKKNISSYPKRKFPLIRGFGDPVVLLWKDAYYFIATNDNVGDIGFYVRKASNLDDLFSEKTPVHIILDKDEKRGLIQTFWAPEFHVMNGNLYILFAVSNENWGPQCHLMKLKEGGDILKAEDWEDPVKIKRKGGRPLGEKGITLDMTYIKSGSRHYYAWSYRENIGSPLDSGSMIMLAEFNPEKPEELITEPICLSRPLYGFENVSGTINNEGPYPFYHNGTIYLSYSGGDARGYLYTIGLLTAKDGDDLGDESVWEKSKTPIVSFATVPGEFGAGHNSFFEDRNGDWWIAFHATRSYEERIVSVGMRRVHIDATNRPRFDLAREEDLPLSSYDKRS